MVMQENKSALSSVGVWGSILSIVPLVLETVVDLGGSGALGPHSALIVAGIGGLLSLYGRLTAKKKITSILPKVQV